MPLTHSSPDRCRTVAHNTITVYRSIGYFLFLRGAWQQRLSRAGLASMHLLLDHPAVDYSQITAALAFRDHAGRGGDSPKPVVNFLPVGMRAAICTKTNQVRRQLPAACPHPPDPHKRL